MGIFLKLFQLVAVIFDPDILIRIELQQVLQEGIGIQLLKDAVGERIGQIIKLGVCQDQRAVKENVTGRVHHHGDAGGIRVYGCGFAVAGGECDCRG